MYKSQAPLSISGGRHAAARHTLYVRVCVRFRVASHSCEPIALRQGVLYVRCRCTAVGPL